MIPIIAHIRLNATGEVRQFWAEVLSEGESYGKTGDAKIDSSPNPFIWEEGNYSCDCNRRIFFEDAGDEEERDFDEYPCGEESFSVNLEWPAGIIFYREFGKPEKKKKGGAS